MHYVVETTDQLTVVTALDPQQDKDMAYACDVCRVLPYLGFIHSDQALVDLGPVGDSADVPQLIGVLCERTRLHLQHDKRGGGTTVSQTM